MKKLSKVLILLMVMFTLSFTTVFASTLNDTIDNNLLISITQKILDAQTIPNEKTVNIAKASIDTNLSDKLKDILTAMVMGTEVQMVTDARNYYDKAVLTKNQSDLNVAMDSLSDLKASTNTIITTWADSYIKKLNDFADANNLTIYFTLFSNVPTPNIGYDLLTTDSKNIFYYNYLKTNMTSNLRINYLNKIAANGWKLDPTTNGTNDAYFSKDGQGLGIRSSDNYITIFGFVH